MQGIVLALLMVGALLGANLSIPGNEALSLYNACIACAASCILLHRGHLDPRGEAQPGILPLLVYIGFVAWACVTVVFAGDKLGAAKDMYYLFAGLCFMTFMRLAVDSPRRLDMIYKIMCLYTCAQLGVVIIEATFHWHLPISLSTEDPLLEFQPTGFASNPNDLAVSNLIVSMFVTLYAYYRGQRLSALVLYTIGFVVIYLAASKACLVCYCIYPILGWLLQGKDRHTITLVSISFVFFLALVGYLSYQFALENSVLGTSAESLDARIATRLLNMSNYLKQDGIDDEHRFVVLRLVLENFDTFLLGLGPRGAENFLENVAGVELVTVNPHNMWIEVFMDYGLLGVSLFVAAYLLVSTQAWRLSRSATSPEAQLVARIAVVELAIFTIISSVPSSVLRGFMLTWLPMSIGLMATTIEAKYCTEPAWSEPDEGIPQDLLE